MVRNGHHVPRKAYNIRLFDEELVEPKDESWKKAWRITEALIVAMNEEVLRARARFVLVTLTIPIQVDPMSRKKKRPSGRWARATCSIQSAVCASLESGSAFPSLRLLKSYKRLQFNGMCTSMGSQTPLSAPVTTTNAATKSSPIY